ncbi:YggT family protein, partial [Lactobacillus taiwanensis]
TYLEIFECFIPPIAGISFSPVGALLVIYFVNNYVLYWIANVIRYAFIK